MVALGDIDSRFPLQYYPVNLYLTDAIFRRVSIQTSLRLVKYSTTVVNLIHSSAADRNLKHCMSIKLLQV